ncbi:hypothetical protein [Nocardioides sp. B-3]|uniref:hypothetical protein n=1 Tax=Nocardioides sp. B-3 TaxID=2895565 RepID=UPI00215358A5|nr:hypothetical protein [Nocardioides sp. B-3]UUZ59709.1 hypothetical protein LP418_00815 [Nocardioides sp. B-3]
MTDTEDGRDPDVGSLAEETAKLLGALNGWAREQGSGLGESVAGISDHAMAAAHDLNDHLATGSAECTVCPVCRTVHAVRQLSPEVKAHWRRRRRPSCRLLPGSRPRRRPTRTQTGARSSASTRTRRARTGPKKPHDRRSAG